MLQPLHLLLHFLLQLIDFAPDRPRHAFQRQAIVSRPNAQLRPQFS